MSLSKELQRTLRNPSRMSDEQIRRVVGRLDSPEKLAEAHEVVTGERPQIESAPTGRRWVGRALKRVRDESAQSSSPRAKSGRGSAKRKPRSQYIREQLLKGRDDYDKLVTECRRKYPDHTTTRKDVMYYRWHLRKAGHDV